MYIHIIAHIHSFLILGCRSGLSRSTSNLKSEVDLSDRYQNHCASGRCSAGLRGKCAGADERPGFKV